MAETFHEEKPFDAFLCYSREDFKHVEEIAWWLREKHLRIWFDKWQIKPGDHWLKEVERGIKRSLAILIFVGQSGLGRWQEAEMYAALVESDKWGIRIIPVLLPSCSQIPDFSIFLNVFTRVDFRLGFDNEKERNELLRGITGTPTHRSVQNDEINRDMDHTQKIKRKEIEALEREEELIIEKIQYLRKCYLIEVDGAHKFKLKKELQELHDELKKVRRRKQ